MKVLLFCITVVLLFFISEDVRKMVGDRKCNEEEFMEVSKDEEKLFCNLTIINDRLCAYFIPVMQAGMQVEQEKTVAFLQCFANGNCSTDGMIQESPVRMTQFTAFLSGRHLHGFYLFCLSRLLI